MLFYELACHPDVFTKNYLIKNNTAVKEIFKNVTEKGSVANLNNGKWEEIVQEKISILDSNNSKEYKIKVQLEKLLKTLNTRKKIIYHQNKTNEIDWLKMINFDIEDFSAILHIFTTSKAYDAEDLLDSELWDKITRTSSEYATQDEEYIKSEIEPILNNARHIDLIDPYFDITKKQYKKSFEIIINSLSNKNYYKELKLLIHIKNQNNNLEDVIERPNYLERWKIFLRSIII